MTHSIKTFIMYFFFFLFFFFTVNNFTYRGPYTRSFLFHTLMFINNILSGKVRNVIMFNICYNPKIWWRTFPFKNWIPMYFCYLREWISIKFAYSVTRYIVEGNKIRRENEKVKWSKWHVHFILHTLIRSKTQLVSTTESF